MFEIYADRYKAPYEAIPIGHQGEDKARCLIWDLAPYLDEFNSGTFRVKVTQPETKEVYWATDTQRVNDQALWIINNVDTAVAGTGMVEMYFTSADGEVLAKSDVFKTWILPTQGESGDAPSPYENLLETIGELVSEAQSAENNSSANAQAAAESAQSASRSASGLDTAVRAAEQSASNALSSATAASNSAEQAADYAAASAAHSGGDVYVTDMRDNKQYLIGYVVTAEGNPAVALTEV